MEKMISRIIAELLELAPQLRGEEEHMRKTIARLLREKPNSGFDENFKNELKARLMRDFSEKQKEQARRSKHFWRMAAMLVVGILALTIWFRLDQPERNQLIEFPPGQPLKETLEPETSPAQLSPAETITAQLRETESPRPADETIGLRDARIKAGKESPEAIKAQPEKRGRLDEKPGRVPSEGRKKETLIDEEGVEGGVVGGVIGGVINSASLREVPQTGRAGISEAWPDHSRSTDFNTEGYATVRENDFLPATTNPLSTFSIDVDTASYANVRRFLMQHRLPPRDAVRIEELINYFDYGYEQPRGEHPLAIHGELAAAPWNPEHKLVMIALQGRELADDQLPPSNLVFLIDVSGSMNQPNKLPLLRESFKLLVNKLGPRDRVAMVVYAGAAGVVMPSTQALEKEAILNALDRLQAGGSTAGGAGINLAYRIARQNFIPGGNNRIILATDGDFNVGPSSDAEMERLIEEQRGHGVFLTVLGFGMGNYKDSKMETLADKGNGNYFYIDSLMEACKVLSHDLRKTLFTIAKDVKIQVEFNPARVGAYRLIGYENRLLKKEDFLDDRKDAGEVGAGHSVTVFYEIIPTEKVNVGENQLKYQETSLSRKASASDELLTVRVRYKRPDKEVSREISRVLRDLVKMDSELSNAMRFASAVAEFGLLLRDSQYRAQASFQSLFDRARSALGPDPHDYRREFLRLVETAQILKQNRE